MVLCGLNLKNNKKNMELRKLLGLDPVSLLINRSRLQWLDMLNMKMMQIGSNDV